MDLKDILAIFWKRRLVVVLTTVVALLAAGGYAFTATKQYQSTATMLITTTAKGAEVVNAVDLEEILPTYAAVATKPTIEDQAQKILGYPLSTTITSGTTAGTGILTISSQGTDPNETAREAGAVARALKAFIPTTSSALVASIVGPATVPTAPVAPRKGLILGAGLILGIAIGLALSLVLERWFDRVSTAEDVTAVTGLACLGYVPDDPTLRGGGQKSLIWSNDPKYFRLQESIRSLRTTLLLSTGTDARIMQVTSPSPGDGKSTIAANLAVAIASTGMPTIIVDADFWAPRQHVIFGISNARGLSDAMDPEGKRVRLPLQETPFENLVALTSGPLPDNPTETLVAGLEATLKQLRGLNRMIVIDSPPVLAISDPRLIAAYADLVVVVAGAERTKSSELKMTIDQLQSVQGNVGGVVLNGVKKVPVVQAAYGHYYERPEQLIALTREHAANSDE